MEYLSNIELYYALPQNCGNAEVEIDGEECGHILKVMRHSLNDELFLTNGRGKIFRGIIYKVERDRIKLRVNKIFKYKNEFAGITFCIPKLKSADRLEFAIEKCTELGVTDFIVFESERTISHAVKIERWEKILLSAMKQSLRSFLPSISIAGSFGELISLKGEKIIFDQNAEETFSNFKKNKPGTNYYLIFGPEGGLTSSELSLVPKQNLYKLAENRLRTETAVIKCASVL